MSFFVGKCLKISLFKRIFFFQRKGPPIEPQPSIKSRGLTNFVKPEVICIDDDDDVGDEDLNDKRSSKDKLYVPPSHKANMKTTPNKATRRSRYKTDAIEEPESVRVSN